MFHYMIATIAVSLILLSLPVLFDYIPLKVVRETVHHQHHHYIEYNASVKNVSSALASAEFRWNLLVDDIEEVIRLKGIDANITRKTVDTALEMTRFSEESKNGTRGYLHFYAALLFPLCFVVFALEQFRHSPPQMALGRRGRR